MSRLKQLDSSPIDQKEICPFCNRTFNSAPALRYHRSVCIYNPNSQRFSLTCCFCQFTASSPDLILQHLHLNHEGETVPRFMKGKYCKNDKPKSLPLLSYSTIDRSISVRGSIPYSLLNSSYHIVNSFTLPGLFQSPLSIIHSNELIQLKSYECKSMKYSHILNCGSSVVSISLWNNLLAVSCIDNRFGFCMNHRSIRSISTSNPPYDNVITIYSLSKGSPHILLHLKHNHGYATSLNWLNIEENEYSMGVLSSVFVDGSLMIWSIPQIEWIDHPIIELDPIIEENESHATIVKNHKWERDLVMIGYSDGSVHIRRIDSTENRIQLRTMSILKGSRGWFDSRGIRCICESPIDNERILISDERTISGWNIRRSETSEWSIESQEEVSSIVMRREMMKEGMIYVSSGNHIRYQSIGNEKNSTRVIDECGENVNDMCMDKRGRILWCSSNGCIFVYEDENGWKKNRKSVKNIEGIDCGSIDVKCEVNRYDTPINETIEMKGVTIELKRSDMKEKKRESMDYRSSWTCIESVDEWLVFGGMSGVMVVCSV
ncbi:hypothetical protein WA588_004737, partial [Blastocystis sp. NMH]